MTSSDPFADWPEPSAKEDVSDSVLEEIAGQFLLALEEGSGPELDDVLARYPHQAVELAVILAPLLNRVPPAPKPGTITRSQHRDWAPTLLRDYDLLFLASHRGGGRIYKAKKKGASKEEGFVALKVLSGFETVDPRDLKRFQREANILSQLNFPGIVPVLEVGEESGQLFFAMPWIEGESVADLVETLAGRRRHGSLNPEHISISNRIQIFASLATLFSQLEEKGIRHRDIKPSNIMIGMDYRPQVIDFGIAKNLTSTQITHSADAALGTPRYMAPELLNGELDQADEQSEVYSLGLSLYEFLKGDIAYVAKDRAALLKEIAQGPPKVLDRVALEMDRSQCQAVMKALEPRQSRYRDMAEFALALRVAARPGRMSAENQQGGFMRQLRRLWPFGS